MSKVRLLGKQFLRLRWEISFLGSTLGSKVCAGEGSSLEQREELCYRTNPAEALIGPGELGCWDDPSKLCQLGQSGFWILSRIWHCIYTVSGRGQDFVLDTISAEHNYCRGIS